MDLLWVAFLTSAKAAASSFLGSTGDAAGWVGSLLVVGGSGAAAGDGAAGVVSLGFAAADEEASEAAVGVGSSFLDFFPNMALKPFFSWAMASGAVMEARQTSVCSRRKNWGRVVMSWGGVRWVVEGRCLCI